MRTLITTLSLFILFACIPQLHAQSGKKEVKLTITKEVDGVRSVIDTSFTVNDPSEIEDVLSAMGIEEPRENQTLEKKIVIRDIEQEGEVRTSIPYATKPMIGVYLEELDHIDDVDVEEGVYVTGITDGGGAEDAGMRKGDIIISIDGNRMNSVDDIHDSKASLNPGDRVNIRYIRDGRERSATVVLKGKKKHVHKPKRHITYKTEKTFLGVVPYTVSSERARELDLPESRGVYIHSIVRGHSAEAAGLEREDVIYRMDGTDIHTNADLTRVLKRKSPGDRIEIVYYRDGRRRSVDVTLGGKTQTHSKWVDEEDAQKVEEKRAYLGVYLESAGDDEGVRITRVVNNTPADRYGLEDDDIIIEIGGKRTPNYATLSKVLSSFSPNERVTIKFMRDGDRESENVVLGEKSVEKWVWKEKIKTQEIDVDVILKTFPNKQEGATLKRFYENPTLDMDDYLLYPNPNEGSFRLRFSPEDEGPIRIKVYNANGQIVYQEQLTDFDGTYDKEIDISDNAKGIYLLQITQNSRGMAKRVVVR